MKTHKIKNTVIDPYTGIVDEFITYCGIDENHSEDMENMFVEKCNPCSCKKCNKGYNKEKERFLKESKYDNKKNTLHS